MSRWSDSFYNHPFQEGWKEILELEKSIHVDDETITTDLEEIARLKKVIVYVDSMLKNIDPDLIPINTWNNFHSQSNACLSQIQSFENNRDMGHIVNANSNLDNLLTYIKPYNVAISEHNEAMFASFKSYRGTVSDWSKEFRDRAGNYLDEIDNYRDEIKHKLTDVDNTINRFNEFEEYLFNDEKHESLRTKLEKFDTEVETIREKLNDYYNSLLIGTDDEYSLEHEINKLFEDLKLLTKQAKEVLNTTMIKTDDFESYYKLVFGKQVDDGRTEGGLKNEIELRKEQLDKFKTEQETKYKTLNAEIENLLPGATSAGLASAYHELKESFNKPIKNYSKIFYVSILGMLVLSIFTVSDEVGFFYIKFNDISSVSELFTNLIYKLPLIIPILWLTMFASKRRSESLRLQQEYAHKEALAKSYQSFKKQIEELGSEKEQLMNKLLESAIDAVAKNASITLDKPHGDKTPASFGAEELLSQFERLRKINNS